MLFHTYTLEEIKETLDQMVEDGIAYIGTDGRYRVREDIEFFQLPDGTTMVRKRKSQ